jgi:acetyltransferase-like isoleucine patch superfamily enzyme
MTIGHNVYVSRGNWFNATGGIYIEDEVIFGPNSVIVTSNHTRLKGSFRYGLPKIKPIKIGFGSWIGGNCSVLAGSVVGKGTVIGANSVIKGIIPDNVVAAGNPIKIQKEINE